MTMAHEFDLLNGLITDILYLQRKFQLTESAHKNLYAYAYEFSVELYQDLEFVLTTAKMENKRLQDIEILVCFFINRWNKFYGLGNNRVDPWDPVPTNAMLGLTRHRGTPVLYFIEKKGWYCFNRLLGLAATPLSPGIWARGKNPSTSYVLDKIRLVNNMPNQKNPAIKPASPPSDTWGLSLDNYFSLKDTAGEFNLMVSQKMVLFEVNAYSPPVPQLFRLIRQSNVFTTRRNIESLTLRDPFN